MVTANSREGMSAPTGEPEHPYTAEEEEAEFRARLVEDLFVDSKIEDYLTGETCEERLQELLDLNNRTV